MDRNGMRVMREAVYVDRRVRHIAYGRRQALGIMVVGLVVFGGMLLGIGVVASRGAATPPSARTAQLEKWVRRFVVRAGGRGKGLVVECRGAKCAAYTPDGGTMVSLVRMANGRYHVLELLVPDVVAG